MPGVPTSGFHTTSCTLVQAAAIHPTADSRQALATLCPAYWHPVYAFIRRNGYDQDQAQDLSQGFFALLLEKNILLHADQERGRFRSDGNRLAAAPGRTITIWDVRTGAKLVPFPEAKDVIDSMAFSPDGTRLVSVSLDGEVRLWDPVRGKTLMSLRESSGPYAVREFTVLDALRVPVGNRFSRNTANDYSISFSPDGRKITLTTVAPDPGKGWSVRIETWDGSPRRQ